MRSSFLCSRVTTAVCLLQDAEEEEDDDFIDDDDDEDRDVEVRHRLSAVSAGVSWVTL